MREPKGFGWRYRTSRPLAAQPHDPQPHAGGRPGSTSPGRWTSSRSARKAAAGMKEVKTQWVDVEGGSAYPVFDAIAGHAATTAASPSPTTFPNAYPDGIARNRSVVDHDATLVGTAGHLHPGGLWTDLKLTRGGRTVEVFRSRAHYYEPAGAVSWDVSMTATPPNWRVAVKKGDVLTVSGTYDSRTTSWYESMAIMPVAMTVAPAGGADPLHDQHGGQGRAHPRPPARERPPRRSARHAARRHQAPRRPARRRRSTSPASPTSRATCRRPARWAGRRWSAPASR